MAGILFLDEASVRQLLTMEDALATVEEAFRELGAARALNVPRVRVPVKGGVLRLTAAVLSSPAHRDALSAYVRQRCGVDASSAASAEQAVRGGDVVVTATTSTSPVVRGEWLKRGVHINAVGANYEHRRELDSATVASARFVATDDREQVRYESADLAAPVAEGLLEWGEVHGLDEVVAGKLKGRTSREDITLSKSLGVAIEDVALAVRAYEKALERGVGIELPDLTR
jgi:alanine dehydrogenase